MNQVFDKAYQKFEKLLALNDTHRLSIKPYGFYWSKKLPAVATAAYASFTQPNDVILDPFLGGGSSLYGLSSLESKRVFLGVEINEMPLKAISLNLQKFHSNTFVLEMRNKLSHFIEETKDAYEYPCFKCDGSFVLDTINVDIEPAYRANELNFKCPCCGTLTLARQSGCLFEKYSKFYLSRQELYRKKNKEIDDAVLLKNTRIAVRHDMKVSDLFSPINFHLLCRYRKLFSKDDSMLVLLSGALQLCKFTDEKSQSQFPYWYPKQSALDRNIHIALEKKIKVIQNSAGYDYGIDQGRTIGEALLSKKNSCVLFNDSITNITSKEIPCKSVDLVFTDPPYFDQVAYSEYLKLWEYFTGYKANFKNEIIETQRIIARSDRRQYLDNLKAAFDRIKSFMKNDAFAIIYFKDSKIENMTVFLEVMNAVGFHFQKQMHIQKGKYTYKQNNSPRSTVQGDCLLFFTVQKNGMHISNTHRSDIDVSDFIIEYMKKYLDKVSGASLGELIDNGLLVELHNAGLLKNLKNQTIIDVLENHFEWNDKERVYKNINRESNHFELV